AVPRVREVLQGHGRIPELRCRPRAALVHRQVSSHQELLGRAERVPNGRDHSRPRREIPQAVARSRDAGGARDPQPRGPRPARDTLHEPLMTRIRLLLPVLFVILWSVDTHAHDSSAWGGLFRSRDNGARWLPVHEGRFIGGALGLAISPSDVHHLLLATDSGLLRSRNGGRDWTIEAPDLLLGGVFAAAFDADGARSWEPSDAGMPEGGVDTVASGTGDPAPLWAVAADQLYRSDDRARTWRPFGRPLAEPNTSVRGIAVATSEPGIVLTTHRGLLRSTNGGQTWELQEGMLPAHLEAGPLVRDPADPTTLYAGFALTPYDEMWRMAAE